MQEKDNNFRSRIELWLVLIIGGISVFIAIVDLTGLLDSSSWIAGRVPALTLLAVGFIASYLILERRGKLDEISQSTTGGNDEILRAISSSSADVIKGVNGVQVLSFPSSADLLKYVGEKLHSANKVDDVTWSGSGSTPRTSEELATYQEYQEIITDVIKRPDSVWRAVVMFFTNEHFELEKKRVLANDSIGYNLGYFETIPNKIPPRIGFMVIDDQEVILSNGQRRIWIAIRHSDIANYYAGYFDRLWNESIKLKQMNQINLNELNKIESEFKDQ